MKSLVIAEKPSVGRDIARVLGCKQGGNGCLEGRDYVVTWALGHLIELSDPESYGEQWKVWKMETLPMLPEKLEIQVIKKTSKQYQAVKAQMHRKDIKDIVIATDAGRGWRSSPPASLPPPWRRQPRTASGIHGRP